MSEAKKIYLDHAATTAVDGEVLAAMLPYFSEVYGNGNSQHGFGREAEKALSLARAQVAKAIGASVNEIYFTSGGTESDNWAIRGIAEAFKNKGNHIITSAVEHPAVMDTLKYLEKHGYEVTYLPVDKEGLISLEGLRSAISDKTILITVMYANNEIGTIEPVAEIGRIAKEHKIVFHTDAVQAFGSVPIDVKAINADLLSLSAHKFNGPKGVGVLYKRNGLKIEKFLRGGEQERNLRASTHNTPGIVGMGAAAEKAVRGMEEKNSYITGLRDYFVSEVIKRIPDVTFNGAPSGPKRLPNNASISFDLVEGESILLRLDLDGIAVSSGSACSSGSLEPSHVVLAVGVPIERAHGTIRFTFGRDNTKEEIDFVLKRLESVIADLRELSPLFKTDKGDEFYV